MLICLNDLFACSGLNRTCKLLTNFSKNSFYLLPEPLRFGDFLTNYCKELKTTFSLSTHKLDRFKEKINRSYAHFEYVSAVNIKKATKDLIDSINYITGNIRLNNSKSKVKVGLFYTNDLLDNFTELDELTSYLHNMQIKPYGKLFLNDELKNRYIQYLKNRISKIDFKDRWDKPHIYKFPIYRLKEMEGWL